jgi:hypothetical protein
MLDDKKLSGYDLDRPTMTDLRLNEGSNVCSARFEHAVADPILRCSLYKCDLRGKSTNSLTQNATAALSDPFVCNAVLVCLFNHLHKNTNTSE